MAKKRQKRRRKPAKPKNSTQHRIGGETIPPGGIKLTRKGRRVKLKK